MTPEQKAFYEYGKARGILKERKEGMISAEGEYDAVVFYHEYRGSYHIEEAIRDAWQKRAASRMTCAECETYRNELKDSYGTIWCDYINAYTRGKNKCVGCPFFQPRKEGGGGE